MMLADYMKYPQLEKEMANLSARYAANGVDPQAAMIGNVISVLAISFRPNNASVTFQLVNQFISELLYALQTVMVGRYGEKSDPVMWDDLKGESDGEEEQVCSPEHESEAKRISKIRN